MLPIDPGDGPGSALPGERPVAQPLRDIVPPQAMAHGGMIIRPGAVAWGGPLNARDAGYSSCEAVEATLTAAARDPGVLPALLIELATTRLWVPLPARPAPVTDGAAIQLPLIGYRGTDFVPSFTSVQRLTAWAEQAGAQRAGDARVVPHIVVPAAGLAHRLPAGVGLAVNPDGVPGLPLYPECLPHLAALAATGRADAQVVDAWVACNTSRLYVRY